MDLDSAVFWIMFIGIAISLIHGAKKDRDRREHSGGGDGGGGGSGGGDGD